MTPEQWRQIEDLYRAAQDRGPTERATLFAAADPEIRSQVERMLAQASDGKILDRPAGEFLEASTATVVMVGSRLGPYKIEAQIGAGGMGMVYRAVDTRLGRSVAIKVAAERYGERFEREARAISSLNHPHICTLHDIGPNYLVMELVEGETLAARLKKGRLSIENTRRYGGQIADALSAAHAKGVTHRDLKPANVMIAKNGIKVLDFGLAKSRHDATVTATNVAMGTPAYMPPEQLEGKEADARTDIYALGLCLYEMATGTRAMPGHIPPMDQLPPHLARVIERCLALDPDDRWQAAGDLKAALEMISVATPVTQSVPAPRQSVGWRLGSW